MQSVDAVHRDLLASLSTRWVEQALGVSRATVANWRRGEFPERRQAELIEAVRVLLSNDEEAPEPEWVRGLRRELTKEIQLNRAMITEALSGQVPELVSEMDRLLAERGSQRGASTSGAPWNLFSGDDCDLAVAVGLRGLGHAHRADQADHVTAGQSEVGVVADSGAPGPVTEQAPSRRAAG